MCSVVDLNRGNIRVNGDIQKTLGEIITREDYCIPLKEKRY